MHERVGTLRTVAVFTFVASMAAAGCSDAGEQTNPQQSVPIGGSVPSATPASTAPTSGTSGMRAPAMGAPMPGLGEMTAGRSAVGMAKPVVAAAGTGAAGTMAAAAAAGSVAAAAAGAGGSAAAGAGGAAVSMMGAAGAGTLPSGATNFVSVCEGGKVGMDSTAAKASLRKLDIQREYAGVKMLIKSPNAVLSFKTTLQVPKTPTARQTLFIWPGLQSRDGASDPGRVGNGVLQPVLTWGPSCAPKSPSDPYAGWWIAGMYVTLSSNVAGPSGCGGGDYVTGALGDLLEIDMFEKEKKWVTTIKNVMMNKTVDYTVDLKGQVQNEVMWLIEVPDGSSIRPMGETIWTQNVLTFKDPVTSCQPDRIGAGDSFSAPTLSPDGLHCCWDKIVLHGT